MLKKLKTKFILINMGIAAAMLAVVFTLVCYFTAADLSAQSKNILRSLIQATPIPAQGQTVPLPYFVIQINHRGEAIASGVTSYDLYDMDFLNDIVEEVYDQKRSAGYLKEYPLRYQMVTGHNVQRIAFVDISSHRATITSLVWSSIFIALASLLAFFGISFLLAQWAVAPVAKAWNQQRQFISDASHELKTPLTVILSNAELLQNPELEETDKKQFTDNILAMSHQMRNLTEGLLELSRADNGFVHTTFAPVQFSELVESAVLPFEPVLYEKGLLLDYHIQPGITLTGNSQYLRQLIDILLDNAGKYAAPGKVNLMLRRQGKSQCLLSVSNPGDPIPKEDLQRIFQRFYRADEARSRTGSFGLGLSIAKEIVNDHKGKIWAESNPTGNCFYILLPL